MIYAAVGDANHTMADKHHISNQMQKKGFLRTERKIKFKAFLLTLMMSTDTELMGVKASVTTEVTALEDK